MTVAYVSDGNVNPALGTRGGLAGATSAQYRRLADGTLQPVPACAEVVIGPDETMVSISGGGGGYGHPHERDPARVLHDVKEGWISRDRAASVYGVVLTDDNRIDAERTAEARQALLPA
ncbi:hydantoinase B/oxoprolinase family protein [Kaistia defluvii]|nr:hydantoinase B/oxoprolinase family protein [Kaistia defluvii]